MANNGHLLYNHVKVCTKCCHAVGGLAIIRRIAGGSAKAPRSNRGGAVVAPWKFSYIALAITLILTINLTQNLKRLAVAPRGSRIHDENVR